MAENFSKWPKWSKMVKNGKKWYKKKLKIVKNGWPDLKLAQRIGLSAGRAQITKSRGPKGLQQEVGPWRGPQTSVTIIKIIVITIAITVIILDVCRYYRREEREEETKVGRKDDSDEEEGGK